MNRDWKKEPTITLTESAILFNTCLAGFRVLFRERLAEKVRWYKDKSGYRFLLTDIMREAFPEAGDQALHMMSLDYLCRLRVSRRVQHGGKPTL